MSVADDHAMRGATTHFVYLVEEDDTGYCYLHFYADSEIQEAGGLRAFEAVSFTNYLWIERLGTIPVEHLPNGNHRFSSQTLQKLVLSASRRVARTSNCGDFEYVALDSRNSSRN
jgi:hypothetical protein